MIRYTSDTAESPRAWADRVELAEAVAGRAGIRSTARITRRTVRVAEYRTTFTGEQQHAGWRTSSEWTVTATEDVSGLPIAVATLPSRELAELYLTAYTNQKPNG